MTERDGREPTQGERGVDHLQPRGLRPPGSRRLCRPADRLSVEIIVADDASTDATPAIIQEYAGRYPHLFRPILRPQNLGLNANLTGALSAARGEYLALCEGDDYWIDPMKLSKQVAFLDRHPETAVCFHPVRVVVGRRPRQRTRRFRQSACAAT